MSPVTGSQTIESLKKFRQTLDLLGMESALRLTWENELGSVFLKFEKLLSPCQDVNSRLEPDFPGRILDLEERGNGDFDVLSRKIPSHRRPLCIVQSAEVRLISDIAAISADFAPKLGFVEHDVRSLRTANQHELGALNLPRQQMRLVFLFLPSAQLRSLVLKEGLLNIQSSVALLPTKNGMSFELRQIAAARDMGLRILATKKEFCVAPAVGGKFQKKAWPPIFSPLTGWEWKHLTISFEDDGLRAKIHDRERFVSWKELGFKPFNRGKLQSPHKLLSTLGSGGRILQRRNNENERQQISGARKILCDLFPLPGNPFHKFSDGYGILFHVELSAAHQKARNWEDTEQDEKTRLPTEQVNLTQRILEGFPIHSIESR